MDLKTLFDQVIFELNINISSQEKDKFFTYIELLISWNKKYNLTAIKEPADIIIKHFADSLTIAPYIKDNTNLIDIGTGAGFPAIPIKIIKQNTHMVLVDSTNKKINFLKHVVDELGLKNIELVHGRCEELSTSKIYREQFNIATSRAVANLRVLSELSIPFIKKDGLFIAMKGPTVFEEIDEAKSTIKILGGKIKEIKEYVLPFTDIKHYLLFVNKKTKTPIEYPRIMSKILKTAIKAD